jgi:MFS family permease
MRAFSGFCFAGAAMIVESWLNEVAENKSRGTIFSVYTTINMTASTLGQLAMSVTGVTSHIPFIVGAISFICAILPPALTSTPQPKPLASAKLDVVLLYKTSPLAVIAAFAVGMANGTFGTLAPVYGHDQGLDAKGIAYLFAVTAVLGALAQVPAGRISDRMDRRMVIVVLGSVAASVGFLTLLINPQGGWVLYVLFGLYGFSAYPIYAIAVAHANDFAKKGEFGRVAGGMLLTMGSGLAIGPAIAALVMNLYQPVGLFIVTATFHGALAVTAFLRMKVRPVRVEGRIRFRAMNPEKGVSPGTVALDPRSAESQEDLPHTPAAGGLKAETVVTTVEPPGVTIIEPEVVAAVEEAAQQEADAEAEAEAASKDEKHVQVGT